MYNTCVGHSFRYSWNVRNTPFKAAALCHGSCFVKKFEWLFTLIEQNTSQETIKSYSSRKYHLVNLIWSADKLKKRFVTI